MGRVPLWKVFTDTFKNNMGKLIWISDEGVGGEAAEGAALASVGTRLERRRVGEPGRRGRTGSEFRVGGERDQGRMSATGAIEEAGECLLYSFAEHGERSGEILEPVIADRVRCPTAADEAAVNIGIPEDAVPVLE